VELLSNRRALRDTLATLLTCNKCVVLIGTNSGFCKHPTNVLDEKPGFHSYITFPQEFQLSNKLTVLYKFWCWYYDIRSYTNVAIFNFLQSVTMTWRTHEHDLGATLEKYEAIFVVGFCRMYDRTMALRKFCFSLSLMALTGELSKLGIWSAAL